MLCIFVGAATPRPHCILFFFFFLLLQEGDFFECAAEGGAVGGGEEEAAEGVDAVDGGGDAAVVVDVFCRHVAVEEQGEVFAVEVGAAAQGGVASPDMLQQVVQ